MYQIKQYEMFSDLNEHNKDGELITSERAIELLKDRFGFDPQVVFDAISKSDDSFNLKTSLNRASGIARWGDINEFIAQQLIISENIKYICDNGQPTLVIKESNVQIIIMSGNKSLGNIDLPISSGCAKGIETKRKIDINKYRVFSDIDFETWILYYPSRAHDLYQEEEPNLIFELARPTSYEETDEGMVFPTNHDCRLMFVSEGEMPSYVTEFADESVNEDSFDIGYKDTGNE